MIRPTRGEAEHGSNVGTFLVDGVKFDGPTVTIPDPDGEAHKVFHKARLVQILPSA